MRFSVLKKIAFIVLAGLVLAGVKFSVNAAAVSGAPQFQRPPAQSDAEREMEERQQRELNKKRQTDIQQDTQKLYQLAGELKDAVGKSNENLLSLDVVRKAEEVEKLAKRVKEKMKEGVGRPLKPEPPPAPVPRPIGP